MAVHFIPPSPYLPPLCAYLALTKWNWFVQTIPRLQACFRDPQAFDKASEDRIHLATNKMIFARCSTSNDREGKNSNFWFPVLSKFLKILRLKCRSRRRPLRHCWRRCWGIRSSWEVLLSLPTFRNRRFFHLKLRFEQLEPLFKRRKFAKINSKDEMG